MEIFFQYPSWLLILCILAGVGYAVGMYFRDRRTAEFGTWVVRILAVLRGLAVFIIALLLLGPLLKTTQQRTEKPVIVIAQDNSSSIPLNPDSNYYRNAYGQELAKLRTALSEKYEVHSYTFGSQVEQTDSLAFDEGRTDLSQLFRELENRYANRNVGAVVIGSDGIYNRGADPVYGPLRLKAPLYAIALGDTSVKKDVVLEKADHNRYAYLGNAFPVEITVQADHFKGENALVQIHGEGGLLWEERVAFNAESFRTTLLATLKADRPGLNRLQVSVQRFKGELSHSNNTQDIFVEVLDGRQKVLILAASPHPDVAALRRSISSNSNYEVEALVAGKATIDPDKYDLIVLHQLPAQGGRGKADVDRVLASQVPMLIVVGGQTDLPSFNTMALGLRINASRGASDQVQPVLEKGFALFSLSGGLRRMLNRFPPLNAPFGEFRADGGTQVVFRQRIGNVDTDQPLMLFNDLSGRKLGILSGDGIWRWRVQDFRDNGSHEVFDGLVSKMVQYLALKADKSLFRVSTDNRYSEDEQVVFNAELYDETYEPLNGPDVNLSIRDADGKEYTYMFNRTETAYRLNVGTFKAGDYSYSASVSHSGQVHEVNGRFVVTSMRLESVNTTADHGLLYRLASQSGGEVFYPKQFEQLAEAIRSRDDVRNVIYEQTWFKEAIHLRWLFAIIVALLSIEWFVRRRQGAY